MNKINHYPLSKKSLVVAVCVVMLNSVPLIAQSGQTQLTFIAKYAYDTGECQYDPAETGGICALPVLLYKGSYFAMGGTPANLATSLTSYDGILLGQGQPAGTGVHGGDPSPADTGAASNPWLYFNSTGHEFTANEGIVVQSEVGNAVGLDFSNWRVAWNNVPEINMGGSSELAHNDTGIADLTCWLDELHTIAAERCLDGSYYKLDYIAHVPNDGLTSFGNVEYKVHLEGTVNVTGNVPTSNDGAVVANIGSDVITTESALISAGTVMDEGMETKCNPDCYDFTVPTSDGIAMVVIPVTAIMVEDSLYRIMKQGEWLDFNTLTGDSIASAPFSMGACPAPGDTAYVSPVTVGDDCIQLSIADGGVNDADAVSDQVTSLGGFAQGVIIPAEVVPEAETATTPAADSSSGSVNIWMLFSILAGLVMVRKRSR